MSYGLISLKAATGAANASLFSCAGVSSGTVKLSDFKITGVTGFSETAYYCMPGETVNVYLAFSGIGSRFLSRIGNRNANFVWSVVSGGSYAFINNTYGYYAEIETADVGTTVISCKLVDGFNNNANNYNTVLQTTIYIQEK